MNKMPSFRKKPAGAYKKMPWMTPERGRGFIPPYRKGTVHILPVYEKPKYGGWVKTSKGGYIYGLGNTTSEMEEVKKQIKETQKQAQIEKWKGEAVSKTAAKKEALAKKLWYKPEGAIFKQQAEAAKQKAADIEKGFYELKESEQQAKQTYSAMEAENKANKLIEEAESKQTILAYQQAEKAAVIAAEEVRKTGQMDVYSNWLSIINDLRENINNLIEYEKEKAAYEAEIRALLPRLRQKLSGVDGLGKNMFQKIFSKPSELKRALKASAPTPKKIKARMKTGLKLMKVALKPSGAKMLAKKGGLKQAMTSPDQFLAAHAAKKSEEARKREEATAPPPESPSETAAYSAIDRAIAADAAVEANTNAETLLAAIQASLDAAAAIRAAGLGEDNAKSWEDNAAYYQKFYDDNFKSIIPDQNIPPAPEYYDIPYSYSPTPSTPSPAAEYDPYYSEYPEEFYYSDEYYYPDEGFYNEVYEGQESEVIPGTEWWQEAKEAPFPVDYEYTEYESESITPIADWYRDQDYIKEYEYELPEIKERSSVLMKPKYGGWVKTPEGGYMYGLGQIKKRPYMMGKGRIMLPKPISSEFTPLTKVYKYEPDRITAIPFRVGQPIRMGFRRKNF